MEDKELEKLQMALSQLGQDREQALDKTNDGSMGRDIARTLAHLAEASKGFSGQKSNNIALQDSFDKADMLKKRDALQGIEDKRNLLKDQILQRMANAKEAKQDARYSDAQNFKQQQAQDAKARFEEQMRLRRESLAHSKKQAELNRQDAKERLRSKLLEKQGKKPVIKSAQAAAAGYGHRVEQASKVFDDLLSKGYDRSDITSGIGSMLPNVLQSGESQQQAQAERNFINAVLRRESGAAIAESEFESAEKQYFPRAGDSPEVLEQKSRNRAQQLQSLKAEAGDNAWQASSMPESSQASSQKTIERRDPKSGRIIIYDAITKQPLKYKE